MNGKGLTCFITLHQMIDGEGPYVAYLNLKKKNVTKV